tara:strand:- start:901 stop:1101 length:201 start_codon:yes stop_codon:yes gene_type:complete
MNTPSKEELEKSKVHLERINRDGEWERLDTFHDLQKALNYGENLFRSTSTVHRLLNDNNQIIELFD